MFLESPLWQTLGAVQNGHVVDVNDDFWIAGLGIQAANLVLNELANPVDPGVLSRPQESKPSHMARSHSDSAFFAYAML